MTFVVTDNCIKCKYTDCVEVCPVDCFYEGPNFLVIHPDECIDCALCEPPRAGLVPSVTALFRGQKKGRDGPPFFPYPIILMNRIPRRPDRHPCRPASFPVRKSDISFPYKSGKRLRVAPRQGQD